MPCRALEVTRHRGADRRAEGGRAALSRGSRSPSSATSCAQAASSATGSSPRSTKNSRITAMSAGRSRNPSRGSTYSAGNAAGWPRSDGRDASRPNDRPRRRREIVEQRASGHSADRRWRRAPPSRPRHRRPRARPREGAPGCPTRPRTAVPAPPLHRRATRGPTSQQRRERVLRIQRRDVYHPAGVAPHGVPRHCSERGAERRTTRQEHDSRSGHRGRSQPLRIRRWHPLSVVDPPGCRVGVGRNRARPRDTFVPKGRSASSTHSARVHTARAVHDDRPAARHASAVHRGGYTLHHRVPSEQPRHASPPRLADKVARVRHERTGIRTSAASTPGAITLGRRSSDEFRNAFGLRSARLFGHSRWETHL